MKVTDKAYTEHRVFAELELYAKFYERLAMSVFSFASMGTKAICNIDTYVYSSMRPLLNFEWARRRDGSIPRQRVKGGRSPAKRTLDALSREIRWRMAGCSAFVHPAMETKAATV